MIIIFDNVDEFVKVSSNDFEEEMDNMKKYFVQANFIITCKEENLTIIEN